MARLAAQDARNRSAGHGWPDRGARSVPDSPKPGFWRVSKAGSQPLRCNNPFRRGAEPAAPRAQGGWTFSKTRLSDNYSYEDFRRDKPADAMEVLVMNEERDVEFCSSQRSLEPEAGATIVYFARADRSQTSEIADAPLG